MTFEIMKPLSFYFLIRMLQDVRMHLILKESFTFFFKNKKKTFIGFIPKYVIKVLKHL